MRLGLLSLLVLAALAHFGVIPRWLFLLDGVLSALLLCCYGLDKVAARGGDRRIPESALHLLGLMGGWPGAAIGQQIFRHKRQKTAFLRVFWLTTLLNLSVVAWLWLIPAVKRLA